MAPIAPAILAPTKKERRMITGLSLKALLKSFGPKTLNINCCKIKRIIKTANNFDGSEIKATTSGGIRARIGPIRGIMAKIPAIRAAEAVKSIPKIRKTIQVTSPEIIPKVS